MNPRQRRGLLLLVLSGLGLLAVFVLVASYVADVRTEVDPKIKLLALDKPVKAFESVPGRRRHRDHDAQALGAADRAAQPRAARRLRRRHGPLAPTRCSRRTCSIAPPDLGPGQREVAILVDAETGVAGKIGPDSVVDIVGTFEGDPDRGIQPRSKVVVPAARIIAVGQAQLKGGRGVQQAEADPTEVVPITFALTPKQQLQVTEAESFASEVRLALRRPGDLAPLKKDEKTYTRPELR